jgi:hypothetical protein
MFMLHTGDVACDMYHKYPEDFKLMKELGIKHYRLAAAAPDAAAIQLSSRRRANNKLLAAEHFSPTGHHPGHSFHILFQCVEIQ